MSKISVKGKQMSSHGGQHQQHEASVEYSDSLILSAEELERLKNCGDGILEKYMEMAQKEQNFRHDIERNTNNVLAKNHGHWRVKEKLGMILAFLVLVGGMVFSFFLISAGHSILGTFFAGGSIIGGASLFINNPLLRKQNTVTKSN